MEDEKVHDRPGGAAVFCKLLTVRDFRQALDVHSLTCLS